MAMKTPTIDLHETMLGEMNEAIDRLTLRRAPQNRPRRVEIRRILVGHDASAPSPVAIEWTERLARLLQARVVVASITPPMRTYGEGPMGIGTYWPSMVSEFERMEQETRSAADMAASALRGHNVDAESVSTVGSPATELARIAKTHRADLVVVGARGGGPVSRVLLGSVAESISGRVDASLLVARSPPDLSKILVATDGSEESDRAVTLALELATAVKGELVVQHVIDYPGSIKYAPPEGYLAGIVERMTLRKPPHVRYALDVGHAAERIVERARREGAGLIVVGARGAGRVSGAFLGSVSHRVANGAERSVLVVRGREP